MKKLILFLAATAISFSIKAQVIHVPGDYPTIQQAIDSAANGDTVLVAPGTFTEGISFNGKKITVASNYLITSDTSFISETIISVGDPIVSFKNNEDSTSKLIGFTLMKGGQGIYCESSSPVLEALKIINNTVIGAGGGIFCVWSSPRIKNLVISGNSALRASPRLGGGPSLGGAMFLYNSSPVLENVSILKNYADNCGGLYMEENSFPIFDTVNRCNIYGNTSLDFGSDIWSDNKLNVIVDTFSVINPNNIQAYPLLNFSFDILHGKIILADRDLWVSPAGDDANSGISQDHPMKTIWHAMSSIMVDSLHQNTINLLPGTYGPKSSGELFPVRLLDYLHLAGRSPEETFLDAEQGTMIMYLENIKGCKISDLSAMHSGYGMHSSVLPGIYCNKANVEMTNILIADNTDAGIVCDNSEIICSKVSFTGNNGGAIVCRNSSVTISDGLLYNNNHNNNGTWGPGGGIASEFSKLLFQNVNIMNNTAFNNGGGIEAEGSVMDFNNVRITGNTAGIEGGGICMWKCRINAQNVSIDSNRARFGGGIYVVDTNYTNGSLKLNANQADSGSGIFCYHTPFLLSNSEITNGRGSGIHCRSSSPVFKNLLISGNQGSGIFCDKSEPELTNLTFSRNISSSGANLYCFNSSPVLMNSVLWNDTGKEIIFMKTVKTTRQDSLSVSFSDIKGGRSEIETDDPGVLRWLEGNIDADPLFDTTGFLPNALLRNSPCIDAGTPDTNGLNLPDKDLAGNHRIWNNHIDMGAYEWNNLGENELRITNNELRISNYPNPVRTATTFSYNLPEAGKTRLIVFNNCGQKVDEVVTEYQPSGEHKIQWDAGNFHAGIYFYRLEAGNNSASGKLIISN